MGTALLAFEIKDDKVQLLPLGDFEANGSMFRTTQDILNKISTDIESRKISTVIDFEHQSFFSRTNGMPAPAAGFFKHVKSDNGLFATDTTWTAQAAGFISRGEYKYISPAVQFNEQDGVKVITKLLNAALTNNPAIDGMKELMTMDNEKIATLDADLLAANTRVTALSAENMILRAQLAGKINRSEVAALTAIGIKGLDLLKDFLESRPESNALLTMQTEDLGVKIPKEENIMLKVARERKESGK